MGEVEEVRRRSMEEREVTEHMDMVLQVLYLRVGTPSPRICLILCFGLLKLPCLFREALLVWSCLACLGRPRFFRVALLI